MSAHFGWIVIVALNLALIARALWICGRAGAKRALGRLAMMYGAFLVLSTVFGVAIGVWTATHAFRGESVNVSNKARVLAESISEAMNCSALGFVTFFLPAVAAFGLFLRAPKQPQGGAAK